MKLKRFNTTMKAIERVNMYFLVQSDSLPYTREVYTTPHAHVCVMRNRQVCVRHRVHFILVGV